MPSLLKLSPPPKKAKSSSLYQIRDPFFEYLGATKSEKDEVGSDSTGILSWCDIDVLSISGSDVWLSNTGSLDFHLYLTFLLLFVIAANRIIFPMFFPVYSVDSKKGCPCKCGAFCRSTVLCKMQSLEAESIQYIHSKL